MRFDGTDKTKPTALNYFGILSYLVAYSATMTVELQGGKLEHKIVSEELTGNATLDCTFADGVGDFESVSIILTADATARTITPTGNVVGDAIVVPISTTVVVKGEIYNGKLLIIG